MSFTSEKPQYPEQVVFIDSHSHRNKRESFYSILVRERNEPIDSELTLKEPSISSSETINERSPSNFVPIVLGCAASLAGFLFGYDTGTISGFLEMIPFQERFGSLDSDGSYSLPAMRSGLIVSAICLGGLIGGLSAGKIADVTGRTRTVMGYSLIYIIAAIQTIIAKSWIHLFVARIVLGIAIGSYTLVVPMLLSESAPNRLREFIVSLFQLFITIGILLGNVVVFNTETFSGLASYRVPIYISIGGAIILFIVMAFMPESPRFLLSGNRIEEAKISVGKFRNVDPNSSYVEEEIHSMLEAIQKDKAAGSASWAEMVTGKPRLGFRVFVGTTIQLLQLLCGANYFFYYGTTLFQQISGGMNTLATPMILSSVNVACTIIGLVFVSKFSRRTVLLTGSVGMFIFFFLFSSFGQFLFHPSDNTISDVMYVGTVRIGDSMIFMACLFILFYAATWAPLAYVILAEIYPQRIRSKAMSLGCASNWLLNFIVNVFTPYIVTKIGFGIGYIFAGCIFVSLIFSFFCVHETKGLTLEQTDEMYASNVSAIHSSTKSYRDEFIYKKDIKEILP